MTYDAHNIINHRPLNENDLWLCQDLYLSGNIYQPHIYKALPRLYEFLIHERCMRSSVLEEYARGTKKTPIAFGTSVFINPELAESVKQQSAPGLTDTVVERYLDKEPTILDPAGVAAANAADGVVLLITQVGWNRHASPPDWGVLRKHLARSFMAAHSGYQIKELIAEGPAWQRQQAIALGMRLRNTYEAYYGKHPEIPADVRIEMFGLTREEALSAPILTPAALIFSYTAPRLGLTLRDQELLEHALYGKTDEELAAGLCLSVSAVKKRWLALYDHVLDHAPDLIAEPKETGSRGVEKRRRLLSYIADHSEELRPYKPHVSRNRDAHSPGRNEYPRIHQAI